MGRRAIILFSLFALMLGCDALDKTATNKYEAATKRWNAGDYRAAVALYTDLAEEHPLSPHADNALYWVGVTQFLYLGETEKALETLQLVLEKYPRRDSSPSAQLYIAKIYEVGYNDYTRAVQEYREAVTYTDRVVRENGYYHLADNLFRIGNKEEAKEIWQRQVHEFPNGSMAELAHFRLGTLAFSKGAIEEAEACYRSALKKSDDTELAVKAKFALAGCLEAREELTEALKLYTELKPVYPNEEALQIKIKALKERIRKKSY